MDATGNRRLLNGTKETLAEEPMSSVCKNAFDTLGTTLAEFVRPKNAFMASLFDDVIVFLSLDPSTLSSQLHPRHTEAISDFRVSSARRRISLSFNHAEIKGFLAPRSNADPEAKDDDRCDREHNSCRREKSHQADRCSNHDLIQP